MSGLAKGWAVFKPMFTALGVLTAARLTWGQVVAGESLSIAATVQWVGDIAHDVVTNVRSWA